MNDTKFKFENRKLLATDRCDSCSAAAKRRWVKIVDDKELELIFCNHHFLKVEPSMVAAGWWLQDE